MKNRIAFTTDPELTQDDMEQIYNEVKTAIASFGGILSGSDLAQLSKAIADAVANSTYYVDSGAVNTYVLSSPSGTIGSSTYRLGEEITFITTNENTGASTINVNSKGLKDIKKADGTTNIESGDIQFGINRLIYNGTSFCLIPSFHTEGIGFIGEFAGSVTPSGYLICDGSAISRTTYARLFSVIGTSFGVGDGSTTFNIPNKKGKIGVGYDSTQTEFNALGKIGGEKTHLLTDGESGLPTHFHYLSNIVINSEGSTVVGSGGTPALYGGGASNATMTNSGVNASSAHNNLQPYIVLNYIIKY